MLNQSSRPLAYVGGGLINSQGGAEALAGSLLGSASQIDIPPISRGRLNGDMFNKITHGNGPNHVHPFFNLAKDAILAVK